MSSQREMLSVYGGRIVILLLGASVACYHGQNAKRVGIFSLSLCAADSDPGVTLRCGMGWHKARRQSKSVWRRGGGGVLQ